ncbi:uncharacterized protein LOC144096849 [Amblyomma americanum]
MFYICSTPHSPVDLSRWCNTRQEVIAILTKPQCTPVLLVSFYGRPQSSTLNLGWLTHLRTSYPGVPILVGGDFNGPHKAWGYTHNSKRGDQIYDTFFDQSFTLLNNNSNYTRPRAPPSTPDLTRWLGPGNPHWSCDADTWGSDHSPILSDFASSTLRKIRRKVHVTSWDSLRKDCRLASITPASALSTFILVLTENTVSSTVNEDQPNPDFNLLNLWARRKQLGVYITQHPSDQYARTELHRVTAKARRYSKRLLHKRWTEWCSQLCTPVGNRHLWRVFHSMERKPSVKDYAESIRLALRLSPDEYASRAALQFFPNYDCSPAPVPVSLT